METLADLVDRYAVGLLRSGPYVPPGDDLVAVLPALVDALVAGTSPVGPAAVLGLVATSREGRVVLHPPEPGGPPWVLLAVPERGVSGGPLVEVPHPYADLHTERVAPVVLDRLPGATLLQAGAHRVAAGPREGDPMAVRLDRSAYPADVARRGDALFSRIAEALVVRAGTVQVQLHGFADRDDRHEVDVVVSQGASTSEASTAVIGRLVAELGARGLRARDPGHPGCADLAGRRNVQGLAATRHGTGFVHLELSRAVRDDPDAHERVADAVAAALGPPAG